MKITCKVFDNVCDNFEDPCELLHEFVISDQYISSVESQIESKLKDWFEEYNKNESGGDVGVVVLTSTGDTYYFDLLIESSITYHAYCQKTVRI